MKRQRLFAIKSYMKPIEYLSKVICQSIGFIGTKNASLDITAIQMDWIVQLNPHLCSFGPIEESPSPRYDDKQDRLVCYRKATIGQRVSWSLGASVETIFPSNTIERFRWFGKFFLDGIICPKLQQFQPALLCSSNAMVKSWASLMERTQKFLNALASKEIDTRARLTEIWSNEPKCKTIKQIFIRSFLLLLLLLKIFSMFIVLGYRNHFTVKYEHFGLRYQNRKSFLFVARFCLHKKKQTIHMNINFVAVFQIKSHHATY